MIKNSRLEIGRRGLHVADVQDGMASLLSFSLHLTKCERFDQELTTSFVHRLMGPVHHTLARGKAHSTKRLFVFRSLIDESSQCQWIASIKKQTGLPFFHQIMRSTRPT